MAKFGLDRLFFKRIWIFILVLFPSWKCTSSCMTVFTISIGVIDQIVTYYVGIVPSEFYVVLGKKNFNSFYLLAIKATLLILAKAIYSTSRLYLKWREIFDYVLHRLYFKRLAFYKLNVLGDGLDNPDQRMTQDVAKSTRILAIELLIPVTLAPFVIIYYTYKTYRSSGWLGPLAIYSYFIISTVISKVLLSPIVALVAEQERCEGDFRFKHVSVRSNSESIGFYHSGLLENVLTNRKLDRLLNVQQKLINWQSGLAFATNVSDYFGGILSYLLIAIPIFWLGSYDHLEPVEITRIISRNVFFYMYLIHSFTKLIALSELMGDLAGVTHRVVELLEELRRLDDDKLDTERAPSTVPSSVAMDTVSPPNEHSDQLLLRVECVQCDLSVPEGTEEEKEALLDDADDVVDDNLAFTLNEISFPLPDDPHVALVTNLTMQIMYGRNLLITGDSGSGKTSILRILAGLWHCVSGRLESHWRIRPSLLLFLSQKPYFSDGGSTLRQQIVYPFKARTIEKENSRMTKILNMVNLDGLLQRCGGFDSEIDWNW